MDGKYCFHTYFQLAPSSTQPSPQFHIQYYTNYDQNHIFLTVSSCNLSQTQVLNIQNYSIFVALLLSDYIYGLSYLLLFKLPYTRKITHDRYLKYLLFLFSDTTSNHQKLDELESRLLIRLNAYEKMIAELNQKDQQREQESK